MRIHDQGISTFATIQHPAHRRVDSRRTSIGAINMQPETVTLADLGDLRYRVDAGGRGCPNGRHYGKGLPAVCKVLLDSLFKLSYIHAK